VSARTSRVATGAVWFGAWLGMLLCWALFICNILVWRDSRVTTTCIAASLPAPLVGWLAFRRADRPLWLLTSRAALYSLVIVALIGWMSPAGGGFDLGGAVFVAGHAYCGSLALGLSGVALRLAWPGGKVVPWAVVYVVVGLVLIFPLPPISTNTYNPVGLFFPVWGVGAPLCVTISGLLKGSRRVTPSADTEGKA